MFIPLGEPPSASRVLASGSSARPEKDMLNSLSPTARDTVGSLEEREVFGVFRRRHRIRQEDVGARAGVVQPRVSLWERGVVELDEETVDELWKAAVELVAERDEDPFLRKLVEAMTRPLVVEGEKTGAEGAA